jgi:hypothetical protein
LKRVVRLRVKKDGRAVPRITSRIVAGFIARGTREACHALRAISPAALAKPSSTRALRVPADEALDAAEAAEATVDETADEAADETTEEAADETTLPLARPRTAVFRTRASRSAGLASTSSAYNAR